MIIAPTVSASAKEVLATKKNVRVLECGEFSEAVKRLDFKR
ncbi:Bifunctional purine biosynthesis protein PurH [Mannheimia haemolytica]|uniref:Bifunctional purine biosynthesis protein PurH n=1 Tax=Mannheimia haemolytica TaxID=75985 RepID=A0A378MZP0_MANHA|nr:Bifunctional purine biosynthesis protein PurH [Mannheimia haemolytica]